MRRPVPRRGPRRVIALATLINTVGNGAYLTVVALFLHRGLQLSVPQTGAVLSAGGPAALLGGPVTGRLADRYGARRVYALTLLVGAATMGFLGGTDSLLTATAGVVLNGIVQTAGPAARAPLVRQHGGEQPQHFPLVPKGGDERGFAAGTALAGWALAVDTLPRIGCSFSSTRCRTWSAASSSYGRRRHPAPGRPAPTATGLR